MENQVETIINNIEYVCNIGIITKYYENYNLIKYSGFVNNNKKEGKWNVGYFYNGDYYYKEINFIDNLPSGSYYIYYKSGKLYEEGYYDNNNKLNCSYKKFYENGTLMEESFYINGYKNGYYKYSIVNEYGRIKEEGFYNNNNKNGHFRKSVYDIWLDKMELFTIGTYKNNYYDGPLYIYSPKGYITDIIIYKNNKIIKWNEYN